MKKWNNCSLFLGVYLIRKHQFLEMVHNCPLEATAFLQTKVSAVVNHESEDERKQFHLLASRCSRCWSSAELDTWCKDGDILWVVISGFPYLRRLFAPSSPSKPDNQSVSSSPLEAAASPTGAVPATAAAAVAAAVFGGGHHDAKDTDADSALDVDDDWRHRTELFDLLVAFYPENMTQPKQNLVDLIQG